MITNRTTATLATINIPLNPATMESLQRNAIVPTRALSLLVTPWITIRLLLSCPTCPSPLQSMKPR